MSKWAAFAGSNGAIVGTVAVAAAAAIGVGLYLYDDDRSVDVPTVAVSQPAPPQTDTADAEPQTQTDLSVPANPPSIDEVRVEPDGLTVIAGRAEPGSKIAVLLDGTENTLTTADDGGSFAAITILPSSAKAQVLTVVQRVGADEIASVDEVILAPRQEPTQLAAAPSDAPTAPPTAPETPTGDVDVAVVDESVADPSASVAPPTAATAGAVTADDPNLGTGSSVETASDTRQSAPEEPSSAAPDQVARVETGTSATSVPRAFVATDTDTTSDVAQDDTQAAPESTEVTVLRSTADGVEVLSNTPPEALDTIALDTISYSDAGDVQLAGRAQIASDTVRVYVNNRPIVDIDVNADGRWNGALPQIDTGTYTLRVDELDGTGQVTSRVETPFRREDPEVLAQVDDSAGPATQITVQTGNTLWAIARDRYGEGLRYVQVFDANRDRIRDPDLIFPGQVFALPE